MAQRRTKHNVYASKYDSGTFVKAEHYIAELVCEKIAIKNRTPLFDRFWEHPNWKQVFHRQENLAKSLLKFYSPSAIINVVAASSIISLGFATQLDPLLKKEENRLKAMMDKDTIDVERVIEKPRAGVGKQTVLGKLRDL